MMTRIAIAPRGGLVTLLVLCTSVESFTGRGGIGTQWSRRTPLASVGDDSAEALAAKAAALREEAAALEAALPPPPPPPAPSEEEVLANAAPSLKGATVLVCGANGNVGSKVVRELLRTTGAAQVRAVVSRTQGIEGYGKLSYEVGAEDGTGTIQPIWQSMDVTMEYNEERQGTYNLDRLTLLQGDVLDEEFAEKAVAGVDAVVYCVAETGPVAGLSFFRKLRAEANKSVESDGVANMASALARQLRKRGPAVASSRPQPSARFVLLSSAITRALPLQRSIGGVQQRRGEEILASGKTGVPSFSVVRSFPYDDFYTEEVGVESLQCSLLKRDASSEGGEEAGDERSIDDKAAAGQATAKVPAITPRDAARFLVSALTDADLTDTVVEIWAGPGSGSGDSSSKEEAT